MKKFIAAICMAVMAVVLVVTLAACGGGNSEVAGTYKLHSMYMKDNNTETTVEVGDEFMGEVITAEAYMFELRQDNTFTFTMGMGMDEPMTQEGTWALEGDKLSLTAEGETIPATYSDGTITIDMGDMMGGSGMEYKITLKK